MVYDESGSLAPFNFSLVLDKIPELNRLDLKLTVISFPKPVDSSNIEISHWMDMAYIIYNNYHQYEGFVILHGTDTMAYSASALSFILRGLTKPVIFTGAQIPIGSTRSDARENFITALEIASATKGGKPIISEVCIYFNFILLRGNRSQKIRSSTFGAFESENYPHLAESGVHIVYNDPYIAKAAENETFGYATKMDPNVAILKIFPNITAATVRGILEAEGLKGIVLESYGSGNTLKAQWFLDLLNQSIAGGMIVVNVSQCQGGSVEQGRYETSKNLSEIGVISGHDMTTESAITKLMYLLRNEDERKGIIENLKLSLRGEMTV